MNKQPDNQSVQPARYEAPAIQTFTQEEFLAVIGPAQGYGGGMHPGYPGGNLKERQRRFVVGMK
jgi:hypothetical protein